MNPLPTRGMPAVVLLRILLGLIALLGGLAAASTPQPAKLEPADIAAQLSKSTVFITAGDWMGSGFLVAPDTVATNAHVIQHGETAALTARLIGTKDELEVVGVTAFDLERDVALIRVRATTAPPVVLADSIPRVGDAIYALGNPMGLEGTFSIGNVSGFRALGSDPENRLIQITAPISPGSSGGPVVDSSGAVVGIATLASRGDLQNANFAIPVARIVALQRLSSATTPSVSTIAPATPDDSHRPLAAPSLDDSIAVLREQLRLHGSYTYDARWVDSENTATVSGNTELEFFDKPTCGVMLKWTFDIVKNGAKNESPEKSVQELWLPLRQLDAVAKAPVLAKFRDITFYRATTPITRLLITARGTKKAIAISERNPPTRERWVSVIDLAFSDAIGAGVAKSALEHAIELCSRGEPMPSSPSQESP